MIARLILAAVFLLSGALKFPDPLGFADAMVRFGLLPTWMIAPLALGIPVFEIFTGAALLCGGRFRSAGALAACGLSLAFVLLYAWAWARGLDVRCSCFGSLEIFKVSNRTGLLRGIVLLALSAWAYAKARRN